MIPDKIYVSERHYEHFGAVISNESRFTSDELIVNNVPTKGFRVEKYSTDLMFQPLDSLFDPRGWRVSIDKKDLAWILSEHDVKDRVIEGKFIYVLTRRGKVKLVSTKSKEYLFHKTHKKYKESDLIPGMSYIEKVEDNEIVRNLYYVGTTKLYNPELGSGKFHLFLHSLLSCCEPLYLKKIPSLLSPETKIIEDKRCREIIAKAETEYPPIPKGVYIQSIDPSDTVIPDIKSWIDIIIKNVVEDQKKKWKEFLRCPVEDNYWELRNSINLSFKAMHKPNPLTIDVYYIDISFKLFGAAFYSRISKDRIVNFNVFSEFITGSNPNPDIPSEVLDGWRRFKDVGPVFDEKSVSRTLIYLNTVKLLKSGKAVRSTEYSKKEYYTGELDYSKYSGIDDNSKCMWSEDFKITLSNNKTVDVKV